MSISTMRAVLALGVACLQIAAPALAQPDSGRRVVRFADLDLATAAGEHVLHQRIVRAVTVVCGDADIRDLGAMSAIHECRVAALAKAKPQVTLAIAGARPAAAYAANGATVATPAT